MRRIVLAVLLLVGCAKPAPPVVHADAGTDAVHSRSAPPAPVVPVAPPRPGIELRPDAGHKFGSSQPGHLHREVNFVDDSSGVTTIVSDNATTGQNDITVHLVTPPLATPVTVPNGGTGNSTLTQFSVLMGAGVGAIVQVSPSAAAYALVSNGTGSYASFQQLAYSSLSGTPTLPTVSGGTGISVSGGPAYTVTNTGVTSVTGGTGISCSPTTGAAVCTNTSVVTWAGDHVGSTNSAQYVAAISGNAGGGSAVPLNTTSLLFAKGEGTPAYGQTGETTDTNPTFLTIRAQDAWSSASTNVNGGAMYINGGESKSGGVTGRRGDIQLGLGYLTFSPGVQVTEPVLNQRVTALATFANAITSTQMPSSTGDGVIYLANAVTTPTASPVSGGIMYESAGAFEHRGTGGADEQTAGAGEGTINTQLGRRRRRVGFLRTSNSTLATILTYTMPASTHSATLEAMCTTTNQTTIANSGSMRIAGQFYNVGGTITAVGTSTQIFSTNVTQFSCQFTISGSTVLIQVIAPSATSDNEVFADIYED